jgi:uncharacterized membrane protein
MRRSRPIDTDRPVTSATALQSPQAGQVAAPQTRRRVESIDVLRGIVMILMALDHVRDYFGAAGVDPTNPATTTGALFFTRWITHICAPVFFLLTGAGAFFVSRRRSTARLSRYLFARGLWLIVLELFVLRCFGWQFNFDYQVTLLTVLWALGWSMLVLSVLVYLPPRIVTATGVAMILVHNLFDGIQPAVFGSLAPIWSILHSPGVVFSDGRHVVFAAYPLIPWVGVAAAGYGLGQIFLWDAGRRRALLLRLGAVLILAFLALRVVNVYGDPRPWTGEASLFRTALSFLNATKYPPSLLFLLMTLGPALLLLRAVDRPTPAWLRPALVIGRVPLFYFVLHVVLMHGLAVLICYVRYGAVHWMFESPGLAQFPVTQPPGWPVSLPVVYVLWACVVAMLYPLCRWFAAVKRRRADWWLSYL